MVRTKKRVPAVISKILKAIEDKPPVEAASLLQAAADDEDSVENQVLLLQARIKLLQDTQKPKRTRRKRKPKPAPVVEEVIEIEPEPEEEKTGTVTAVDLDNLGALFGAVERSAEAAEAAPPPAPPKKQNGTGSVDFGELNALMSDDAPTPDTQDAVSQQKEIDPDESDDTAPSASKSGAFEMPDLSALNDLGDTGEDPSDDDLSALMSAMSGQTAEPEPQDEDTSADASDDDLSALMGAM
ncbi:hypothetical protein, partial [Thalassovita sp.]|uniref:hypothetical protein n=1 Tax=Thalassovita sp. TaxID=1979401 RepID=UPI002B270AAD